MKQVQSVFPAAVCVQESFHQKKAEDWKGRSANVPDNTVPGDLSGTDGKKNPKRGLIVGKDQNSGMIDQHQNAGKKLKGTAA